MSWFLRSVNDPRETRAHEAVEVIAGGLGHADCFPEFVYCVQKHYQFNVLEYLQI